MAGRSHSIHNAIVDTLSVLFSNKARQTYYSQANPEVAYTVTAWMDGENLQSEVDLSKSFEGFGAKSISSESETLEDGTQRRVVRVESKLENFEAQIEFKPGYKKPSISKL